MAKGNQVLRKFNKKVTNPILGSLAGKKYFYASLVKHTGRRSGKVYATPVLARRIENGFAFVLPYGMDVDWYQNIIATGTCRLISNGEEFSLINPKLVEAGTGMSYYGKLNSLVFRILKIDKFFIMEIK
jgi:deazaflavin-dependent oxidoreductase (nitroreductase family)